MRAIDLRGTPREAADHAADAAGWHTLHHRRHVHAPPITRAAATETTAPIRYNAAAAEVEQALADLSSIEPSDVRAVGRSGGPWIVEFKGNLSIDAHPELTGDGSGLTGWRRPDDCASERPAPRADDRTAVPKGGNTSLGGHFTLSSNNGAVNDTTAAIPWNATAAAVQTALGNLASIGSDNVAVTGPAGGPWSVSLTGLPGLAGQPLIVANAGGLTGWYQPRHSGEHGRQRRE